MEVSLTTFVDFVLKTGTPRLTQVKNLCNEGDYAVVNDYYKVLRDAVKQFHEDGGKNWGIMDNAASVHKLQREHSTADDLVKAYKKFLGRKHIEYFEPPKGKWEFDDLSVRINPEIGLVIDGVETIVKIYWKDGGLMKKQADLILLMMHAVVEEGLGEGYRMCVLDIRRSKPFFSVNRQVELEPLLRAEARAFVELWNAFPKA